MASLVKKSEVVGLSVASFGFCIVMTLLLLSGAVFSKVKGGELVNVLLGSEANVSLIQASQDSVLTRVNETLSNDTLGRSTVFLVWMFVGLSVYALATGISKAVRQLRDVNVQMRMINQNKTSFVRTVAREWAFRTVISLLWVVFTLFCVNFILPFFLASVAIVFGENARATDWGMGVLALTVVFISFHAHVILARLFLGRVRLFS